MGILAEIISHLYRVDMPEVQLMCPEEREQWRAGGDLLRDSQEEKALCLSVGKKGPSSVPQTGVAASLTLVNQWSLPTLHTDWSRNLMPDLEASLRKLPPFGGFVGFQGNFPD